MHLFHLPLEIVNLFTFDCARLRFAGLGNGLLLTAGERGEHGKGALKHFHVAPHLVLDRRERSRPKCLRHLLPEFFLLSGEGIDRHLEISRHQHLHAVAVKTDELAQEGDR